MLTLGASLFALAYVQPLAPLSSRSVVARSSVTHMGGPGAPEGTSDPEYNLGSIRTFRNRIRKFKEDPDLLYEERFDFFKDYLVELNATLPPKSKTSENPEP